MQSLDPQLLAKIKDMPLIAKTVAEGFLQGIQPSVLKGSGIEFSQYRSYEPGDAPSLIDWKLFGRTDRYYIREAEQESDTVIWLVIDASQSMMMNGANTQDGQGWNKLEYAKHLAASLAYIGQKQGDSIGLLALGSDELHCIPPGVGWQHWQKLLLQLSRIKAGECFPRSDLIGHYCQQLQRPNLVLMLSDFWQQQQEVIDFITQVSYQRNEVAAIQLQCMAELQFDYQGLTQFNDLETGERLLLDAAKVQSQYLSALDDYQDSLELQLKALSVQLNRFTIEQPLDSILTTFLNLRRQFNSPRGR